VNTSIGKPERQEVSRGKVMGIKKLYRNQIRRLKNRRKNVRGTPERPRMVVYRSNTNISVQIVDDISRKTLVSSESFSKALREKTNGKTKTELSVIVGSDIAQKAREKGINKIVFDRNGYRYLGRVKALADAARQGGLEF
jgi:large subunit ribosomal protein L18